MNGSTYNQKKRGKNKIKGIFSFFHFIYFSCENIIHFYVSGNLVLKIEPQKNKGKKLGFI